MEPTMLNSYAHFKECMGGYPRNGNFLYRGIDAQFKLLPSISYTGEANLYILQCRAKYAQRIFNKRFLKENPAHCLTDYQLIFLARHSGLISPYMDFTTDDTVAIQFGIEAAKTNPVHLYVIDNDFDQVNSGENEIPKSSGFGIYKPSLIWRQSGFLTPERTQLIQSARLITQSATTLATPFNETFSGRIRHFEILPKDFDTFKKDIIAEGIKMDASLIFNRNDRLFQLAQEINKEVSRSNILSRLSFSICCLVATCKNRLQLTK